MDNDDEIDDSIMLFDDLMFNDAAYGKFWRLQQDGHINDDKFSLQLWLLQMRIITTFWQIDNDR